MTDLETAILDILRKSHTGALTLSDVHAQLVWRYWDVRLILPHHIMAALIALTDAELIGNELSWRALSGDAPSVPEPKP